MGRTADSCLLGSGWITYSLGIAALPEMLIFAAWASSRESKTTAALALPCSPFAEHCPHGIAIHIGYTR